MFKRFALAATACCLIPAGALAQGKEIRIAHVYDKTGALEAYAKQTQIGLMMGLEYATGGKMEVGGRKLVVIEKDTQGKPDIGKAQLAAAYGDDKVDIAVGPTSSGVALAMLPVAEEYKRVLLVEPAVADSITGDKWNRYIFRTGRNSSQDAIANGYALGKKEHTYIATLAQDSAFGKDFVKAFKDAFAGSKGKLVFEEYAPMATNDFTASAQRLFDALKDRCDVAKEKACRKIIFINWAGAGNPFKISDLDPKRYGIEIATGGNILPAMAAYKAFPGMEGATYYYYEIPKNPINKWLVEEHKKRYNSPPDFFTAGGMAAGLALVEAFKKAGSSDTEKLIATMEGMSFETPKGKMIFRKDDHQALQSMFHFRIKVDPAVAWAIPELVDEVTIDEIKLPIRNKK